MTEDAKPRDHWADVAWSAGAGGYFASCLLELRDRVAALEANSKSTPKVRQIRSSLVERVAFAIDAAPIGTNDADEARFAIREVAAWLKENGGLAAQVWSEVIEQEAEP